MHAQRRLGVLVLAVAASVAASVAPISSASAAVGSASDSFTRTVVDGLGSADSGGTWTLSGPPGRFAAAGGAATVSTSAGGQYSAYLGSTSIADTDLVGTVGIGAQPAGGSMYAGLLARHAGAADYTGRVIVSPSGSVAVSILAGSTSLKAAAVAGLTTSTGSRIRLRLQALGANPTTLQARAWMVGTAEPATWQVTATDSTPALQVAGSVGVRTYLSSSATNGPIIGVFDDVAASSPASQNSVPTASFAANATDLVVAFDGTGSTDPDGPIVTYAWTFGDGANASGATQTHTYANPGTYSVTLAVTDGRGATASATRAVPVVVTAPNRPPAPVMLVDPVALTATLWGDRSADPDGTITAYSWEFGDGGTAAGATTSHTYAAPGVYFITLAVTDNGGARTTATRSVQIFASGVRPTQAEWLGEVARAVEGGAAVLDTNAGVVKPAIVLDIDNTSLQSQYQPFAAAPSVFALGQRAIADGYAVLVATGRSADTGGTLRQLTAAGYRIDSLCFRDPAVSGQASKAACRSAWAAQGFTIVANVGNHTSDLVGGNSGRQYLLPNYGFLD